MAKLHAVAPAPEGAMSINPATGETLERYAYHSPAEVEKILATSQTGFAAWRAMPIEKRVAFLRSMAIVLRRHAPRYAELMTHEMGKLIAESKAEIEKCAHLCEWYAEHGPAMLADEKVAMEQARAYVSFLPIGTILGVMPWNFPFWQAMRACVPILLGGNGFVLKHAHNVLGSAYALETAWREAGLPEGVFSVLAIPSDQTGDIIADARIAAVTLTGSGRAGASVAALAGKHLKKTVLELGGADPFIVLADADLDAAVEAGIKARFNNAGQVCIAAKRFILEAYIAQEFTEKFVAKARALVTGNPFVPTTTLAPLAREDLRETLHQQVQRTIAQGAKLLCGGKHVEGAGYFYEATVLGGVKPGMVAFEEEMFGPVAAMTMAKDAEEAIALANRSQYGLSGNLWTGNAERARDIARRLETGAVFVNGFSASDPRTPIGGVKQSGYGRELSHFGIREFVNAQTVVMRT